MATIEKLWLATLTKNENDAGTDADVLNLTIDVNGEDMADIDFGFMHGSGWFDGGFSPDHAWLDKGQAAIAGGTPPDNPGQPLSNPIDMSLLTNSSIRLGIRDDDAWGPQHVLVFGQAQADWVPSRITALAMETDWPHWLSTDSSEGHLTMPIRLVGQGDVTTQIQRVLLLVSTMGATDDPIQLQITAGGNLVVDHTIADTPQDDLEQYTNNWYWVPVSVPFKKADVTSISLNIIGNEAWLPEQVYVFGLDTANGRPNEVVTLSAISVWGQGELNNSGSVSLPISV